MRVSIRGCVEPIAGIIIGSILFIAGITVISALAGLIAGISEII